MKIEVYFTIPEVDTSALGEAAVVVVDVVRATTTIVEALASGARAIYPMASTEEAARLAGVLDRAETLLCGERRGVKVEGFDLGNSPREFTPERVEGRRLVMSTTNGTRALAAGEEGARLLAVAFTNLGATARAVSEEERLVVVCAGISDRFSLDDALCAGHLVDRIGQIRGVEADEIGTAFDINDAAKAALDLARSCEPTPDLFRSLAGGAALTAIGMGADLDVCAAVDRHDLVAELNDKAIIRVEA
jgi:2-phosphosulfolactate phosphatase